MKRIQSTCNYCALDCNLDFYVENERIVKVLPTKGYPVNDGFACIKGISLDRQQTRSKPDSLPRIRQEDGSFKQVSWEEGFRHVADKIKEIQGKYGPESFAGISTGQLTLEEFGLFGHVMRDYLQTNVDGNTRLCMATAAVAHKQSYGFDAPGYTLKDLELSDTIIFIGANPVVAHPILWEKVLKNDQKNKKVIVIDPRKSETAVNADHWYGIAWKSDLYLLYTIANQLVEKEYPDQDFIEKYTEQFVEYKEFLKKYTLELGAEKTRLSKEQILELVEMIHNGKRVSFWWTMGVNQGYEAVRTAQAIINLALMTGNIGKPGTGANSITGQCNAMSSRVYSNTTCLFGGGEFTDPVRRERIAEIFSVAKRTVDLCASEGYVWDGVKRDRLLWVGDLAPEVMALTSIYGRLSVVERSLDLAKKLAPAPKFMNDIYTYSMWWIIILADYYKEFSCKEYVKKHIRYLVGLLDLLDGLVDEKGDLNREIRYLVD